MNSQFSGFVAPVRVHIRTHGPRLKADSRLELQSRTAFIQVFIRFFFWSFQSQIALIESVWSDEKNWLTTALPVIMSIILSLYRLNNDDLVLNSTLSACFLISQLSDFYSAIEWGRTVGFPRNCFWPRTKNCELKSRLSNKLWIRTNLLVYGLNKTSSTLLNMRVLVIFSKADKCRN